MNLTTYMYMYSGTENESRDHVGSASLCNAQGIRSGTNLYKKFVVNNNVKSNYLLNLTSN